MYEDQNKATNANRGDNSNTHSKMVILPRELFNRECKASQRGIEHCRQCNGSSTHDCTFGIEKWQIRQLLQRSGDACTDLDRRAFWTN